VILRSKKVSKQSLPVVRLDSSQFTLVGWDEGAPTKTGTLADNEEQTLKATTTNSMRRHKNKLHVQYLKQTED